MVNGVTNVHSVHRVINGGTQDHQWYRLHGVINGTHTHWVVNGRPTQSTQTSAGTVVDRGPGRFLLN